MSYFAEINRMDDEEIKVDTESAEMDEQCDFNFFQWGYPRDIAGEE